MAGFVESFVQGFMGAKQLEDQRRRDEDRAIHAAVDDFLRMEELRSNERSRKDQLQATKDYRNALIEDKRADNARADLEYERKRSDQIADNQRMDARNAVIDRQGKVGKKLSAMGMGYPTGQAMALAEYTPEEITAELAPVLNQRNAAVTQQNQQAEAQNLFGRMVPALAQMMAGGIPVQTPPMPQQHMQAPVTMNDLMMEVAPIFQQNAALKQAQIDNYGSLTDLRNVQSEIALARDKRLSEMAEVDQKLKQTQAELNRQRAADIPKARLSLDAYREGVLDHQKVMEGIARLNSEYRRGGAARQQAVQDARAMREWYSREDSRLGNEMKPLKAEEEKAAAQHILVGEQIAALRRLGPSIKPEQAEELNAAQMLWTVGEKRLRSITGRIKELETERATNRNSLRTLSGIGETPVTPAGKPAPVSTGQGNGLTRQFQNNRTGQLEWFRLEGGQWVKDQYPTVRSDAEAAQLKPGTKFRGPDGTVYTKPGIPHVKSVAEALELPAGARFYDPNGVLREMDADHVPTSKLKPLDAATAQKYLNKAQGNKDRAREMARKAGYSF